MKIVDMKDSLFKEYDLRGIVGDDLTSDDAYTLGLGLGSYLQNMNFEKVIVGRDNRLSSKYLETNLIQGLINTGIDVIRLGLVTTPMVSCARKILENDASIMITASHNPKEYNGFKIAFDKIGFAYGDKLQKLKEFINKNQFKQGHGSIIDYDIKKEYLSKVKENINIIKPLKVVVDCGNGTASTIVKDMLDMFDIEYDLLYCESDGTFPNHHPDPNVEDNMKDLENRVKELNYDLGIGIDGDGDRLAIIDNDGNYVTTDYYLLIMSDYLHPDKVLYDVKASKVVKDQLEKLNIKPVMYKTGSSLMNAKMQEDNFLFGAEYSGHVFYRDKWYGIDDGLYNGLRFMEMLSNNNNTVSELVSKYPKYPSTYFNFAIDDDIKFDVVDKVKEYAINNNCNIIDIDGVRIETDDSFVLVRASNTSPNLTIRIEADTEKKVNELKDKYVKLLNDFIKE